MNYAGHEKLRADVAEVANSMCDLRDRLNDMEHRCRFDSDVLVERGRGVQAPLPARSANPERCNGQRHADHQQAANRCAGGV